MGRTTRVSIVHRRAFNQAMLQAGRIPNHAILTPALLLRCLRSALRMSQAQLARRCGVPSAHIARLESGKVSARLDTIQRVFAAMFCDLLFLPRPRRRPGDVLAERYLNRPWSYKIWDEPSARV